MNSSPTSATPGGSSSQLGTSPASNSLPGSSPSHRLGTIGGSAFPRSSPSNIINNSLISAANNSSPYGSTSNTGPPPMLRAVTSSAAFNRNNVPTSSFLIPGANNGDNNNKGGASNSNSNNTAGGGNNSLTGYNNNNHQNSFVPSSRNHQQRVKTADWRTFLSIEERQALRSKIRDAYKSTCSTYEDLLTAACAIEEELLHISAPSRLDYFKSGFEFENRVKMKKTQIQNQSVRASKTRDSTSVTSVDTNEPSQSKKPRNS